MEKKTIYHIATKKDLKTRTKDGAYIPEGFDSEGFIHCSGEPSVAMLILKDYFTELAQSEEILILEIDTSKLEADFKFEAPVPKPEVEKSHVKDGILFPHIYGPLNINAVSGVSKAESRDGEFIWPEVFIDILEVL